MIYTGLAFVIYFTFWHPRHPLCRAFLLACSTIGGSHMIYLVNHAGFLQGELGDSLFKGYES